MGRPSQCNVCCGPIVDPDDPDNPDPPIGDCGGAICIAFIDENTGNQGGQINITEKVNAWAAAYPDRLLFVLNVDDRGANRLSFPPEFSQKDTFFLLRDNGPPVPVPGTFQNKISRCNGDTTIGNGNDPWGKIVAMVNYYEANGRAGVLAKFNAASEVSIFIDNSGSMSYRNVGQSFVNGEFVYEGTIKRLRDDIVATGREIVSSVYNGAEDVFCPFVTANCCPTEGTNTITNLCGLGTPCTASNISFVKQPTNGLIREYCDDGDPQCDACVDEQTEDEQQTIEYTARISNSNGVSLDYESIDYVLQGSDDNGQTWFDVQSLGSDFSNVEQSLNVLTPNGECPSFLTATQDYKLVGDRILGQVFTEAEYNSAVASEPDDPAYNRESDIWDVKYAMSEPMSDPTINDGQEFRFLHAAFIYYRFKQNVYPISDTSTSLKVLTGFLKQFRVFNDGTVQKVRGPLQLSNVGVEYNTTGLIPPTDYVLEDVKEAISLSIDCAAKPDPDGRTYNAVAVGFSLNVTGQPSFVDYWTNSNNLLSKRVYPLEVSQDPTTRGFGYLVALSKEEGEYPNKLVVGSAETGISPGSSQLFVYDIGIVGGVDNLSVQSIQIVDSNSKQLILRSLSMSLPIYNDVDDRSYYKIAVGCYGVENVSKDHLAIYETPLEDGGSNSISTVTKYNRGTIRKYGDNVIIDESASLIHVDNKDPIPLGTQAYEYGTITTYSLTGSSLTIVDTISGPFNERSYGIWSGRLSQAMSRESSVTKEHVVASNQGDYNFSITRLFSFESINGEFTTTSPVSDINSTSLNPLPPSKPYFQAPLTLDKTGSWGFVETSFYASRFVGVGSSAYDSELFPTPQSFAKSSSDNVCDDFTISQVNANCKRLTYNRLFRIKATSASDPSFTTNSSTFQLFEWIYTISDDPPPDDPAQGLSGFVKVQSLDERIGATDSYDPDDTGTFLSNDTYSGAPAIPIVPEGEIVTLASNRTGTIHAVTILEKSDDLQNPDFVQRIVRVYYADANNPDKHYVLGNITSSSVPEIKNEELFGESLAVSENGRYIFIGCPSSLSTAGFDNNQKQGKVIIFEFTRQDPVASISSGSLASEYQKLNTVVASSSDPGWGFGYSIDILRASDDEDYDPPFWLAVGDPATLSADSYNGVGNKVYLYRNISGGVYTAVGGSSVSSREAKGELLLGGHFPASYFGMNVKIRPQDKRRNVAGSNYPIIAVSAPGPTNPDFAGIAPSVAFIKFNGTSWFNALPEITANAVNNQSPATGDTSADASTSRFGASIRWIKSSDVAGNVNSILIGAPFWKFNNGDISNPAPKRVGVATLAELIIGNNWTLTTFWGDGVNISYVGGSVAGTFVGVDTDSPHEEIIGWTFVGQKVADGDGGPANTNTSLWSFDSYYFDTDRNTWVTYSLGNDLGFAVDLVASRNAVTFSPYTDGTPRLSLAAVGFRELPYKEPYNGLRVGNLAVYSDEPKALIGIIKPNSVGDSIGIKLKFAKNEANDNNTQNVRYLNYDRVASNSTYIPARAEGTQTATAALINDFTFPGGVKVYSRWFISKNGGELEDTGQSSQNPYTFTYEANDSIMLQASATTFLP